MLEDARRAFESLAWLSDSATRKALKIRGWCPEPQGPDLHFFAPDFALNDPQPWLFGDEAELPAPLSEPIPRLSHRADPSAADFNVLHEEILKRIENGEFQKVVPMVCEELEFEKTLSPAMFPQTFSVRDHQFSYGFAFDEDGLCGLTPELLFAVEDGVLHTMALAGTGPANGPNLLEDPKESREHGLVIEHIVSELKDWGSVEVATTRERQFGVLKHLYTPIRVELNRPPKFMELVVRLHPTAALGGWPRKAAVEWLQKQSFHQSRRRFGAPFGFSEGERMQCVVAIRCLQWHKRRAWISSGCGVVMGSETLKEWKELQLKRRAIYQNLGLHFE